jgi:hypothetical protein
METTLPLSQVEGEPTDQGLLLQYRLESNEEAFRTLLGRVATSVIFLASSLIVYYLLPFYPTAMSVILALLSAIIAYRWPAIALWIMLLFAAPAYSYQLGVTIWALAIIVTVAMVLPFGLAKLRGACLGSALGAAAGALMLTNYFLLSLPLLAGITLLRLRGSVVGAWWGLFMFLLFYLPFLFVSATPVAQGETVPLFAATDYSLQPALNVFDLDSLQAAFGGQINNNFSGFQSSSTYFVEGWGGIALVLTMLMATVVTPAIINPAERIEGAGSLLRWLAPLLMLLAIELVFLVPLQLLQEPLGYHTGFDSWDNIAIVTGIMFALGSVAFVVEEWLRRRNLKVKFRGDLAVVSLDLYGLLEDTTERLEQVALVCHNRDLGDEKAAIAQCEEKVALTLESADALGLLRLQASCKEFFDMRSQLYNLQSQLETILIDHLLDSRRSYKAIMDEALTLGIPAIQDVVQTLPPSSKEQHYDNALVEQETLNSAFQELAGNLVSAGDMVANTIKDEIDPDFSLTTIDIAHGFLDQGRFEEAARTVSEDLQIIDGRIENSVVELADKVVAMTNNFKQVMTSRLIPVFESIGDSGSLSRCHSTVDELEAIAASVQGSRTLADIINIVEQSRKLANLITDTVSELRHLTAKIEVDNDRRCPPKYNWGKNNHASSEVQQLLSSIASILPEPTIGSRFSVIEKAVQAVEQQAKVIKQYSQASELLINYPNIEYILQERLGTNMVVGSSELPVNPKHALEYLKMYAAKNHDEVTFDPKSGTLKGKKTGRDETSQ